MKFFVKTVVKYYERYWRKLASFDLIHNGRELQVLAIYLGYV